MKYFTEIARKVEESKAWGNRKGMEEDEDRDEKERLASLSAGVM